MNLFITGANRGLGFSLTKQAVKRGHRVYACMRAKNARQEELTKLSDAYPEQVQLLLLDVLNEESIVSAKAELQKQNKEVNVIINNAAVLNESRANLDELAMEEGLLAMDVNVLGPVRVAKHFLPLLTGERKTIINISSDAGSISNTYGGNYFYGMSKAALNMFSEKLRLTYPDIRVFSIHPGWMHTDMGGEKAPLDPDIAADGILDILEGKTVTDSAHSYIDYTGKKYPF
ncbi:NAD(P)-dependent dehydrogenase, short-chain alcohol dehydrogenase family [Evansella caseinilytica]|uniref:NAD(P)-dependent dehydrogenase, short-chain alcohol dehydrogenase family n=1 Tax=Evansella caseinilytica TaxID=1503961 RepID=A0A1H3R478_9BACI|nr:SDR family NAD(P)-dependent oxidoreductase [Evansella caseinilytica]SDZ19749.1 NAD(P)-dependent dehydrogenase, short-chain alcohol dehydrogenase family [Evansella caseinilytica]